MTLFFAVFELGRGESGCPGTKFIVPCLINVSMPTGSGGLLLYHLVCYGVL